MVKLYDENAVVSATTAVTTTASTTGVNIAGLAVGEETYAANITISSLVGTVDGSNYHSVQLESSATLGGTYTPVGNPILTTSGAKQYNIAFSSEQLAVNSAYFRLTTTKVGTTATGVSVACYLTLDS